MKDRIYKNNTRLDIQRKKVVIIVTCQQICEQKATIRKNYVFKKKLFNDGGPSHIETSPFICRAKQWTGFYIDRDIRHERIISNKKDTFTTLLSAYDETFFAKMVSG